MLTVILACLCFCMSGFADDLLPWQRWVERPTADPTRDLESLFDLEWRNSGGDEGRLELSQNQGPWGGRYFNFSVNINHSNQGEYRLGWPSFETQPDPPLDFSGYDAVQYWIRCDTKLQRKLNIRFILWTDGELRINTPLELFAPGKWVHVTHKISDIPHSDRVDRLHFFVCERDYYHGDEMIFRVGGFRLCKLRREVSKLDPGDAALGLWVGQRADKSDRAVILQPDAKSLPALMAYETGKRAQLLPEDDLVVHYYQVFTGERTLRRQKLKATVQPAQTGRINRQLDVSGLQPGYYLVTVDIRRDSESLLGGRVGADDLYIKKPGESMTYTVLSIRTGMVQWV
ncbi:MAG: hypothetical protein KAW89_03100, partial [Armatimonadetes bacterium]|nr:hypothetical protein [Armatimonadota bacterium]